MTLQTARNILATLAAWRERRRAARVSASLARRVAAANPEIAKLQAEIAERAKRHAKVEPLRKQLHDLIVANLAREQGRAIPERIAQ